MKRFFVSLVVVLSFFAITQTQAATFEAPKGSEITASVSGETATVNTTMSDAKWVEQYRTTNKDGKGWSLRHSIANRQASFNVYDGDRFQIVNGNGEFLFISPEACNARYKRFNLKGVVCDCKTNPKGGCSLQVE